MAYRFNGTDPFLRLSIGPFNGINMENSSMSGAALLKRNAASAWHGIHTVDSGAGAVYTYLDEFNPSNQLVGGPDGVTTSTQTYNDTTNWMIVGFTWDVVNWVWRWKIGAGAWGNESHARIGRNIATATSSYRHIIGNEPGLGDDANFDLVCVGAISSSLTQSTFESLDMLNISTWDAVFTGSTAMLTGFDGIGTRSDRATGGANEINRSAGITLVSDPPGWSWGASAVSTVVPRRADKGLIMTRPFY